VLFLHWHVANWAANYHLLFPVVYQAVYHIETNCRRFWVVQNLRNAQW